MLTLSSFRISNVTINYAADNNGFGRTLGRPVVNVSAMLWRLSISKCVSHHHQDLFSSRRGLGGRPGRWVEG